MSETMSDSRFFSFGCSFTNYKWPTWADIIGSNFSEYQNWGKGGGGNQFIFNSLIECHLKNKITPNDIVGIMWTNVTRLDSYKSNQWHLYGNIYTQDYYPKEVVDLLADIRGFYIRDLATIYAADQLLEKIGCKYYMFSMVDITNHSQYQNVDVSYQISDVLDYYQAVLKKIKPSMHQIVFNYDWNSRPLLMNKELLETKSHYQKLAGKDWPEFEEIFDQERLKKLDRRVIKEIFNLNKWDWRKLFRDSCRPNIHPTPLEHLEYISKVLPEYSISYKSYNIIAQIDALLRNEQEIPQDLLKKLKNPKLNTRW